MYRSLLRARVIKLQPSAKRECETTREPVFVLHLRQGSEILDDVQAAAFKGVKDPTDLRKLGRRGRPARASWLLQWPSGETAFPPLLLFADTGHPLIT